MGFLKMFKSKYGVLVIAGILLLGLLSGCGSQNAPKEEKVLRVGSETTYPPFEFEENGKYVGFDVDLAEAVAKQIGYKFEFKSMGFDALIPALESDQIDMIAAGLNATPERAKVVNLSKIYFDKTGFVIVVNKKNNDIKNWNDLQGKKIAAQIGTIPADLAHEVPNAQAKDLDTIPQTLDEVKTGTSDATILDKGVALYYMKQGADKDMKIVGDSKGAQGLVFAFRKNNPELQAKVDNALEELKANGTYDKIYEKWFGKEK